MKPNIKISVFLFFATLPNVSAQTFESAFQQYPLKKIEGYCSVDTTRLMYRFVYTYDWKKRLLMINKDFKHQAYVEEQKFEYNREGQLVKKIVYQVIRNESKLESFVEYNYSDSNLVKQEFYNSASVLDRMEEFEYVGNQKVRANFYSVENGSGEFKSSVKYRYDNKNRLVATNLFNLNGFLVSSVTYEYENDLLRRELQELSRSKNTVEMEYNEANQLIRKIENGKVIQEDSWERGRLVNRKTYDFGIDPCLRFCCGNYTIKFYYY